MLTHHGCVWNLECYVIYSALKKYISAFSTQESSDNLTACLLEVS